MDERDCSNCESHVEVEKKLSVQEVLLESLTNRFQTLDSRLYHIFITLFILCLTTVFSLAMTVSELKNSSNRPPTTIEKGGK